jgi:multimeric flavodoxin WrbA
MGKKVVAIVGSYRKGGTIDTAVEAIMAGARDNGAQTHTVYLTEQHIEFCSNCRSCTQTPGPERGKCPQRDDMEPILAEIETADAIVLASPVNCGNVTAIFRRFLERLMGCAYWPWGQSAPTPRSKLRTQKAILVASSAMPGIMLPIFTGASTALRTAAKVIGAKTVDTMWIGLAAGRKHHPISLRVLARARRIGMKLA